MSFPPLRWPRRATVTFCRRTRTALLGLALLGSVAAAQAEEVWRIDNLERIGGHPVRVVGSPSVVAGEKGPVLHFDGAHDGIFVPAIPVAGAEAFTLEVLFRPEEGGPAAQRFFHVEDSALRRGLLEIRTNGKGGWWLDEFLRTDLPRDAHGLTLINPQQVHPTNRWYWVAMCSDGHRLVAFLDGVKELEGEGNFPAFGDGRISLGVRQTLVYWFKGAIAEVRFHREVLPPEKLQRLAAPGSRGE